MFRSRSILVCLGPEDDVVFHIMQAAVDATSRDVTVVRSVAPVPAVWIDDAEEGVVGWCAACRFLIPPSWWSRDTLAADGALDMLQALVHGITSDATAPDALPALVSCYVSHAEAAYFRTSPDAMVGTRRTAADVAWAGLMRWAVRHLSPHVLAACPRMQRLV